MGELVDIDNLLKTWSYNTLTPANWAKHFPEAKGLRQSPIDLEVKNSAFDPKLEHSSFKFHYNHRDCVDIKNNGNTWMVSTPPDATSTFETSVFPGEKYRFLQMHAHWGSNEDNGSEHTISGEGFAMEIHMVHYNEKYGSAGEAAKHGDGFVVLGVFAKEGQPNPALQPLIKRMDDIKYKAQCVDMHDGFDLTTLLPKDKSRFWTYEGSLTTPPCTECVLWLVFKDPISVSDDQLNEIRQLNILDEVQSRERVEKLIHNVRPVQDVGQRQVRCSF